jgi:CDP-glycerol glycerophosphotransferase
VLSVVVPVYRVEQYVARCLDSILDQAGGEVEIIAVDDHSPDSSGTIIDAYARRDIRVQVVHLAANVGLGRARNAGLERARGTYVWFVDSDDALPAGTVPAVLARLAASRPDVLVVDHAEVFEDGRVVGTGPRPAPTGLPDLLRLPLATSACTKVIRRGLLAELDLRFPPGWYEDCAFTYPLLLAAERIDVLDRVCYHYRQRADGAITKSVSVQHFDIFEQYDRMWARIGPEEPLRPLLFRLTIDHLLVIAGNDHRLPAGSRRPFFQRTAREFRRRLPEGGYELPGGLAGLKHRLVRANAYLPYAVLRLARVALSRWRGAAPVAEPAPAGAAGRSAAGRYVDRAWKN